VIDEGSQLRHHLMAAGIVRKYTWRHWRELLEDLYEFSRFCRLAYAPVYVIGIPWLRTGLWGVSFAGLLQILTQLL
jgi:hypothetical protein